MSEPTPLDLEVPAVARSYTTVREPKGKPNTGPEIERWLSHVGRHPGDPYCAAYVSCVIWEAGMRVPVKPRLRRSASARRLGELNPELQITESEARERLAEGLPVVFIIHHPNGKGHTGFGVGLVDSDAERFNSVEANTGPGPNVASKDREGDGCYERFDRTFAEVDVWLRVE